MNIIDNHSYFSEDTIMERRKNHSKKRDAILACVRSTDAHPTAEWVYQQLKPQYPDLSLGTVYRNLALFKREGVIGSACIEDGMERFDRVPTPHAHFVCNCCHSVQDLMDFKISESLCRQASEDLQVTAETCQLILRGQCTNCAQRDAASSA